MLKNTLKVNQLTLKSRVVMPPMATAKSTADGQVTDALISYYNERAKGGRLGLIITEHCYFTQQGKAGPGQMSLGADADPARIKKLTDIIHTWGVPVFAQINHAGSAADPEVTGLEAVSASAVVNPGKKAGIPDIMPRALTQSEILEIEDEFVAAALKAKAAGYDGIEIHSAHGYLLDQFLSPLTNKRTDAYGAQTIENRTRFQTEILQKVRAALGADYPIAIRVGGCDYMEGGTTIEDGVAASLIFQENGADLIDLSGGMCRFTRADNTEPGYFTDLSKAVKEKVSVPVLVTGGITTAEQAERILREEKADLIGIGRAIMKNADWTTEQLG